MYANSLTWIVSIVVLYFFFLTFHFIKQTKKNFFQIFVTDYFSKKTRIGLQTRSSRPIYVFRSSNEGEIDEDSR